MLDAFAVYIMIINAVGVWVMWSDKQRAVHGKWRIKEITLFLVALAGGAIGTTYGMFRFRHKTKHWYFRYGMPLIVITQVVGFLEGLPLLQTI